MTLKKFKSQFSREKLHLNNAGLAPISKVASERIMYWAQRFYRDGFYSDGDYMQEVFEARKSLAKLLKTDHGNIAFFQSTAGAVSQISFQFPLEKDDEVLMWDQEYGSHLYPWLYACKRKGATLKLIDSEKNLATPFEKILENISTKTKVVAISWVQFQTGAITDLYSLGKELQARNIFFMVDGMQGLGLFPIDIEKAHISAFCGGSHKWLVSPVGVGFLALAKKFHHIFQPHNVGASTFGTCDDPSNLMCEPKIDALKFEAGSKQVLEIVALKESLQLILETGVENISKEANDLAKYLRKGLTDLGFVIQSPFENLSDHQGSIVNFYHPTIHHSKLTNNFPCLYAFRNNGIRLSPHAFNELEDLDKILNFFSQNQFKKF